MIEEKRCSEKIKGNKTDGRKEKRDGNGMGKV